MVETFSIKEKNAIDCWLFRAYTGLRHNEMNQVDIKKILDDFIEINDTKKRSTKNIGLPPRAINILERNNGKLPLSSQQSENVLIKRLAKGAEIDRIVYTSCVVEKKFRDGEFELHQTITTQTPDEPLPPFASLRATEALKMYGYCYSIPVLTRPWNILERV
jgi:CHAD domain-containing protein